MRDGFTFGEKSTWDFSMHVEKLPTVAGAERKRTTVSVAGRNGALHFCENAFKNYTQQYECYFHGELPTPAQAHAIKGWLLGSGSYQRLEDVYDPEHFRLASYVGPLDIANQLNKFGRCTVKFDCAPQSFLKIGEYAVSFLSSGTLYNPTAFTALPIIRIYGTGAGTVAVGTVMVQIKEIAESMILDCDLQNAYRLLGEGAPENHNSRIYAPEFPKLQPGANAVSFTGDITKLEIIPRWWVL